MCHRFRAVIRTDVKLRTLSYKTVFLTPEQLSPYGSKNLNLNSRRTENLDFLSTGVDTPKTYLGLNRVDKSSDFDDCEDPRIQEWLRGSKKSEDLRINAIPKRTLEVYKLRRFYEL